MDISKFYNIIKAVNIAGIKQIIINKQPDGNFMVCGADDVDDVEDAEPSIAITSIVESDIVDNDIGISNTKTLLNRLNLFNLNKVKTNINESNRFSHSLEIKEGRKKVSYTFSDPSLINVPSGAFEDSIVTNIVLTKEYVQSLSKAKAAMNANYLSISGINTDIILELSDDNNDTFSDVLGENKKGEWKYNWNASSVLKLLTQIIKEDQVADLGISELGVLYLEMSDLMFMVLPQEVD